MFEKFKQMLFDNFNLVKNRNVLRGIQKDRLVSLK